VFFTMPSHNDGMKKMPQIIAPLTVMLALSACTSVTSSLGMARASAHVVEIDQNTFKVYVNRVTDQAEAHRTNVVFPPPSRQLILAQGALAITKVTGCEVKPKSVKGDQAIVKADLACSLLLKAPQLL
jgi:hypothetical protein